MTLPFDLAAVSKVQFYKRDDLTTDLICCDVDVEDAGGARTWFNHEETDSWAEWLKALNALPGFDQNWFAKVSQPPFEPRVTVAYERSAVESRDSKD